MKLAVYAVIVAVAILLDIITGFRKPAHMPRARGESAPRSI